MIRSKRFYALVLSIMIVLSYVCALVAMAATSPEEVPQTATDIPVAEETIPQVVPAPVVEEVPEVEEQQKLPCVITPEMIDAVCEPYGLVEGNYWATATMGGTMGNASHKLLGGSHPTGSGYVSYNYQNQYECHGFACYVQSLAVSKLRGEATDAVPRTGNHSGFVKLLPEEVTYLQIGDVVRIEGNGAEHTALVYDITEDGRLYFLESAGGNSCRIRLGEGFNHTPELNTLEAIMERYPLEYVYRYTGEVQAEEVSAKKAE